MTVRSDCHSISILLELSKVSIIQMYLTFVRPMIPCFEAAYGAFPGALMVPCTDDMLIILPQPE